MVYPRVLDVMFRVGQAFDESTIISKQQQAFAVTIQTPCRVDIRYVNELLESRMTCASTGELREDTVGFVENNVTHNEIIIKV